MRALGAVTLFAFGLTACTGILGSFDVSDTQDGGGTQQPGVDGSTPGQDGGPGNDSGPQCATAKCVDPSTLLDCDGKTQACAFSCTENGGAHCGVIVPTAPVATSDLTTAGVGDVTITADTKFFTETGAIENVRPANGDPAKVEVTSNVGFHIADVGGAKVAVWSFKSLTIPTGVTVRFDSAFPAAFVSATQIAIVGVVDLRGYDGTTLCGKNASGPGGGLGGAAAGDGSGPGGGHKSTTTDSFAGGASAGSFAAAGGTGGHGANATTQPASTASAPYGTPALSPLVGGSGGGGSGGSPGGGGGGAIQLVAGTKVSIGGGASPGGINAGGCSGHGAAFGSPGSAAGSGGGVLVEAPALEMLANGVIAANGGNGATGNGSADPAQPGLNGNLQFGAPGVSGYGGGGGGGSGGTAGGAAGFPGTSGGGGSGGGSTGRIRINNRSASFSVPAGAIVSPSFGITPNPPTSAGPLTVQ